MFSKLLRPSGRFTAAKLLAAIPPRKQPIRSILGLVPPNQYDIPIPPKLQQGYVMKVYWETIPLFITTYFCFALVAVYLMYASKNKMDIVYSTHNRDCISRTMDLRNPSVHKLMIINQRYEPWPEMQDVLDKMAAAEKRSLVRMQSCNHA